MSRIMTDLRDAVASIKEHHSGKTTLRTSTVPKAKLIVMTSSHVRRIRDGLNMSQEVFARYLHMPRRTLEKWEQGLAKPTGAAAALLALVERHPDVMQELAAI
jgi:putative transcriptional regulator